MSGIEKPVIQQLFEAAGSDAINIGLGEFQFTTPRILTDYGQFRSGEFSTSLFSRYQRSEQALVLAMIEMVINGVSTRKIKAVTEELCGTEFSKSTVYSLCKSLDPEINKFRNRPLNEYYPFLIVDTIYLKVRRNNRVRSVGLQIVKGINSEGYREIVGFNLTNREMVGICRVLPASLSI